MTPYAVLKVKHTDSDEAIRRAYHALARLAHPDSTSEKPQPAWYRATTAYNAIKTVACRIAWEAQLRIQARPCVKCRGYGVTGSRVGGIGIKVCVKCAGEGRTK